MPSSRSSARILAGNHARSLTDDGASATYAWFVEAFHRTQVALAANRNSPS